MGLMAIICALGLLTTFLVPEMSGASLEVTED
jgi:hypothetical protein